MFWLEKNTDLKAMVAGFTKTLKWGLLGDDFKIVGSRVHFPLSTGGTPS